MIKDDDVTLTCDVDANPAASSIHWLNSAGALIGKCVRFVEHTGQRFKKSAVFSSMFVERYEALPARNNFRCYLVCGGDIFSSKLSELVQATAAFSISIILQNYGRAPLCPYRRTS